MRGKCAATDALPLKSDEVPLAAVGTPVKKPAPQVLVVDDEALIRWSVAETLSMRGMQVSQASDGASVIRLLVSRSQPFDVIVLDLRLPDVSDLSLLSKVRELSPASRVIMMTAFGTYEVTRRAVELGALRIIPKPFELEELASLVEKTLAA